MSESGHVFSEEKTFPKSPFCEFRENQKKGIFDFWESVADERKKWINRYQYYYDDFRKMVEFTIPEGERVLYVGCGWHDALLASVNPRRGVGIDISPKLIERCKQEYPHLKFIVDDPESFVLDEKFDYIILIGILGFCFDVQAVFQQVKKVCHSHTKVFVTHYNHIWEPIFRFAENRGLRMSQPHQNWIPMKEFQNILEVSGFEVVKKRFRMLLPIYLPFISMTFNRILANLWPFRSLCLTEMIIARPVPKQRKKDEISCSVIVPCKDEKGHIEQAVTRIPHMGKHTELIFIDDKSDDGTGEEIRRCMQKYQDKDIKLLEGPGICKAECVRVGFQSASGDVLIILDADLAMAPEELPKFFDALVNGAGDFINGVRFLYPQQDMAMRMLNILGNNIFARLISFILEQPIGDTLCGTKAFFREDYWKLVRSKDMWGVRDQWGDFEQLFGASKIGLKIVDIPVHYMERTYGETKMKNRFKNGWFMLKMCIGALSKLRFI